MTNHVILITYMIGAVILGYAMGALYDQGDLLTTIGLVYVWVWMTLMFMMVSGKRESK